MSSCAVFLDRDGTLNEDPGYLGDPDKVILLPYVGEMLSKLKNEYNFLLIVVSNQSGIARGLITDDQVKSVNMKINSLLAEFGAMIDKFYYCPFHPDYNTEEECKCRKPSPWMINIAVEEYNIDISHSYFIGDSVSDIISGKSAGVNPILVMSGNGRDSLSILQKENNIPRFVAENFLEAGNFIIKELNGANC